MRPEQQLQQVITEEEQAWLEEQIDEQAWADGRFEDLDWEGESYHGEDLRDGYFDDPEQPQSDWQSEYFIDRQTLLNSAISLISDIESNTDELRYVLNLLYPAFPEFSAPIFPTLQNRFMLIGHLTHKIYIQLALSDPYHPYNDLLILQQVVFEQTKQNIDMMRQFMQSNVEQARYQEYVGAYLQNNCRGLMISQYNMNFYRSYVEQLFNNYEFNNTQKLRILVNYGSIVMLLNLLLLVVEGKISLPHRMLEDDVLALHKLIDLGEDAFANEQEFSLFPDLAEKLQDQDLAAKFKVLQLSKPMLLLKDLEPQPAEPRPVEPIVVAEEEETIERVLIIATDKIYSDQEIALKLKPAIDALDGNAVNQQVAIYGGVWNLAVRTVIKERLSKLNKNSGKFSEKPTQIETFINLITPDFALWPELLQSRDIHPRLKKAILQKILTLPPTGYSCLAIASQILDPSMDFESQLLSEVNQYDIDGIFRHTTVKTRLVNPDGSTILHQWATHAVEDLECLTDILDRHAKDSNCVLYGMQCNGLTFLYVVASKEPYIQQAVCQILKTHPAFGDKALRACLIAAIKNLDIITVQMICNVAKLKLDPEILLLCTRVPFGNQIDILDCLCLAYNDQQVVDPNMLPIDQIESNGLGLIAVAIIEGRNIGQAKYLIKLGLKCDKKYQDLNLAQLVLLCAVQHQYTVNYALEALGVVCAGVDDAAAMLNERSSQGFRCLEYAARITFHNNNPDNTNNLLILFTFLLGYIEDIAEVSSDDKNIFHVIAESSYMFVMHHFAQYVASKHSKQFLQDMLSRKAKDKRTPLHMAINNNKYSQRQMAVLVLNLLSDCVQESKALPAPIVEPIADRLCAWAENEPENLAGLEQLLRELLEEIKADAKCTTLQCKIAKITNAAGQKFLDIVLCRGVGVTEAVLEKIFSMQVLDLTLIACFAENSYGHNLYARLERAENNEAILGRIRSAVVAAFKQIISSSPTILVEIGTRVDFFALNKFGIAHHLASTGSYASLQKLLELRQLFRAELYDAVAIAVKKRVDVMGGLADPGQITTGIIVSIFGKNDLNDIRVDNISLAQHLNEQLDRDSPEELKTLIESDVFVISKELQAPTDTEEWADLLIYAQDVKSKDVKFDLLARNFLSRLKNNQRDINEQNRTGHKVISDAAGVGSLLVLKFVIEEGGAVVSGDIMAWAVSAIADTECLDYLASVYNAGPNARLKPLSQIVEDRSLELFDKAALKEHNFAKIGWLVRNGLDCITQLRGGFSLLQVAIGTISAINRQLTMVESAALVNVIISNVDNKKPVINAQDHYGYTSFEELVATKVPPQQIPQLLDLMQQLLNNGADIDHISMARQNIFHLAMHAAMPEVTKFLLTYIKQKYGNAKLKQMLDAKAVYGRTVLHYAAVRNVDLVAIFLAEGANPAIADDSGKNVLQFARLYHKTQRPSIGQNAVMPMAEVDVAKIDHMLANALNPPRNGNGSSKFKNRFFS